jgi:hypothetical protein
MVVLQGLDLSFSGGGYSKRFLYGSPSRYNLSKYLATLAIQPFQRLLQLLDLGKGTRHFLPIFQG